MTDKTPSASLFPEWLEKQLAVAPGLPERIQHMHRVHGVCEGHKCGECEFLMAARYARTYYKCTQTKMTHGKATDWSRRWPACGLFRLPEKGAALDE